jgi:hypothetical protein
MLSHGDEQDLSASYLPYSFIFSLDAVTEIIAVYFTTALSTKAGGSVVGSGTMPQAGRSRVRFPTRSLGSPVFLILSATLWPWGRLSL